MLPSPSLSLKSMAVCERGFGSFLGGRSSQYYWALNLFSHPPCPSGHHFRRHPQENCSFRREHFSHNLSHSKGIPRETPNPWGSPPGDTLAVTSFVGPEPRDVLVCPARCSQRLRRPRPAGGAGEPTGGIDGSKEEHGCSSGITIATDGGGARRAGEAVVKGELPPIPSIYLSYELETAFVCLHNML